jgi:hypothetical protein
MPLAQSGGGNRARSFEHASSAAPMRDQVSMRLTVAPFCRVFTRARLLRRDIESLRQIA